MPHLKKVKIGNHIYGYIVQSVREGKHVRHKIIRYLGNIDKRLAMEKEERELTEFGIKEPVSKEQKKVLNGGK